ncbi:ACBP-domain-containing protein [Mycena kentingensis (nom. inval.)]|nr:ACBP-domain-containing protein [Mycena kentingensis (nom. inval.)]
MSASQQLIDAQFDRAVQIVQSFPKNGVIQTGFASRSLHGSPLTLILVMMRSSLCTGDLYKQATVGNVAASRPGMFDPLGRAKWDAWARHKDLDPYEAKWLYVAALMKVLRKYSDRTVTADLIRELESYGGDPSNLVMSRTLSGSQSDSSGSTASDDIPQAPYTQPRQAIYHNDQEVEASGDETETDEEEDNHNVPVVHEPPISQVHRPPSSASSHRYRTPMAGSLLATSPPPGLPRVPETQPLPGFETPSAFAEPHATSSFNPGGSYVAELPRATLTSPPSMYTAYRDSVPTIPSNRTYGGTPSRPISRPTVEHAIENVQAHLAALSERLESLESSAGHLSRSRLTGAGSPPPLASPSWRPSQSSSTPGHRAQWDLDDLGMWSLVAHPISRGIESLREAATFFARDENRSPTMIIVRRLCLDVSFLLCVLAVVRTIWKASGVRRREVRAALIILWRAIIGGTAGGKAPRVMVERGV